MKIWVDDLRPPPDDTWKWLKTSRQFITCHSGWFWEGAHVEPFEVLSLDHDLGGDDTTRPVVLHLCEVGGWPDEIRVHTANPVGRDWLEGMIARYKP